MNDSGRPETLGELLDQFSRCLDAESSRRIVEFRVSPGVQERMDWLATQANEGALSAADLAEYKALIEAADFIAILRLKADRNIKLDAA